MGIAIVENYMEVSLKKQLVKALLYGTSVVYTYNIFIIKRMKSCHLWHHEDIMAFEVSQTQKDK
jgi:hypothetical protein